jgi:glycosyltransferase involved in cell wall biosynthesis
MKVNITIPVLDEEAQVASSVRELVQFLAMRCRFESEVVIADNGSTDATWDVAGALAKEHPSVRRVRLSEKGRGRAVKKVWAESDCEVLTYMDVDLATELSAFPPLVESIISGGFDLAVGSRLLKPRLTTRGLKREFISRSYNRLIKLLFDPGFSDAQCGFKAISRRAARALIPLVESDGWFMDTELLLLAERLGYRIFDCPVRWVDDPGSRVALWATALSDVKGLLRLRRKFAQERLVRQTQELHQR